MGHLRILRFDFPSNNEKKEEEESAKSSQKFPLCVETLKGDLKS